MFFSLLSLSEECEGLNYAVVKLRFCLWWEGSALCRLRRLCSPPALWVRNSVGTCRTGLAEFASAFLTVLPVSKRSSLEKMGGKEEDGKVQSLLSDTSSELLVPIFVVNSYRVYKAPVVCLLLRLVKVIKLVSAQLSCTCAFRSVLYYFSSI